MIKKIVNNTLIIPTFCLTYLFADTSFERTRQHSHKQKQSENNKSDTELESEILGLSVLYFLNEASKPKHIIDLESIPIYEGQTWSGKYLCFQGWTDLVISIKSISNTGEIDGLFSFHHKKSGSSGIFNLYGKYDDLTRHLKFRPGKWIKKPSGYRTAGMDGTISSDGKKFSGNILGLRGCHNFSLSHSKQ